MLGSFRAALTHRTRNCPEHSLQGKNFNRPRCYCLPTSRTCIFWMRRKKLGNESSDMRGVGCMRVVHQSLCDVVQTDHVLIRYQLVWVVAWGVGRELHLGCTKPVLEAGLAECMPAIR